VPVSVILELCSSHNLVWQLFVLTHFLCAAASPDDLLFVCPDWLQRRRQPARVVKGRNCSTGYVFHWHCLTFRLGLDRNQWLKGLMTGQTEPAFVIVSGKTWTEALSQKISNPIMLRQLFFKGKKLFPKKSLWKNKTSWGCAVHSKALSFRGCASPTYPGRALFLVHLPTLILHLASFRISSLVPVFEGLCSLDSKSRFYVHICQKQKCVIEKQQLVQISSSLLAYIYTCVLSQIRMHKCWELVRLDCSGPPCIGIYIYMFIYICVWS